MGRSTFVFQLEDRKTFSALPRMEAVDGGRLRGRFETGSSRRRRRWCSPFSTTLHYHYNILLRFLYFGEEEMATQQPPGVEAAKTASVFDVLLLRRSLLLEEDGLEPPLSTRKTFVPHDFHIATNSRDCLEKK